MLEEQNRQRQAPLSGIGGWAPADAAKTSMILVVKHGAGRLPPNRVTLYERAVEVLLDTWNIRGHDPLNLKEAVPQLACVALQLTRAGKQNATERELLALLEQARERVPQIDRYAKDTPDQFLKRVELRSSLLVEAGHQMEDGRTVPFYQFRHLTFQEYLTAVAVVEGHYIEYNQADTLLTPLEPYLNASQWKEVIPLAAVRAGKRAEPLMAALVRAGQEARREALESAGYDQVYVFSNYPEPIEHLVHCLLEEAEAAPETLTSALQLIALFAHREKSDLAALGRGPYGEELLHQTLQIYRRMDWPAEASVDVALAVLAVVQQSWSHWLSSEGGNALEQQLKSADEQTVILGLMTCAGLCWMGDRTQFATTLAPTFLAGEQLLYSDSAAIVCVAAWLFGLTRDSYPVPIASNLPEARTMDRLLDLWLNSRNSAVSSNVSLAISSMVGRPRKWWQPSLTSKQIEWVREKGNAPLEPDNFSFGAATVIAFHARARWSDEEIAERLNMWKESAAGSEREAALVALKELGDAGRRFVGENGSRE